MRVTSIVVRLAIARVHNTTHRGKCMPTNNKSTRQDEQEEENTPVRADGGTPADSDDPAYGPMTFYLKSETQRQLKRWLNTLEVEHDAVFDSDKSHQYEAIVQIAMEHEDEVVQKVSDIAPE